MDGRGSAGNPSPALSHSHPARTNEETLQSADWISAPARGGGHSRELVCVPLSQKQKSPAETHLIPAEIHKSLADSNQSPPETQQSPGDIQQRQIVKQSLDTHQTPAETQESPAGTNQSPPGTQESPAETNQSPGETNHSPPEPHESLAETHESLTRTHQMPTKTQERLAESYRSPAETQQGPDQLGLTKHINHRDCPTEKHKPGDYLNEPNILKPSSSPSEEQKLEDSPLTEKQKMKDSSQTDQLKPEDWTSEKHQPNADQPTPEKLAQGALPTVEQDLRDSPPTDQPKPKEPQCPFGAKHEQKPDKSQQHQTREDLTNHKTEVLPPFPSLHSPLLHLTVFTTKDQQNHQDPPPENFSVTTPGRHQVHLSAQQAPPTDLNIQQAAPSPPPSANQQNLSSQRLSQKVHLTEAATLAPPYKAPPFTSQDFSDQVRPCPPISPSGEPKLCGFLLKQGGPLKAWKLRWFTYEDKKNQLFYYRTPQDVMPLGRIELCSATFTYPLKAEKGTFHIKTPERTFVLKAVTQELMLYWLQQLQVKRWQHRQMTTCPDSPSNNNSSSTADHFLPLLKSPLGLVGEEAANVPSQRAPLANMSLKHPLIEIHNSVHSLRKRSSQEWSHSVFHVESPTLTDTGNASVPPAPITPTEPLTPPLPMSSVAEAGQERPVEGRKSPLLFNSRSRMMKNHTLSTRQVTRRDTLSLSSDRTSHLRHEKQMLMEEVKAQKELVWILHKALEASQLEKRTCAEFLAETGEQERLELLRHRERQAADLRGQLEEVKAEAEVLRKGLAQREAQLSELQDDIRMLTEKNKAKQEVIIKLCDQVNAWMAEQPASSSGRSNSQTFRQYQQEIENLKDDIEAYKTQNKFLNSEIYQLTGLWRTSSEQEKSLMMKCAFLEASNCQVESQYLSVLRQLQETKSLDPDQREAVQKMVEDALKRELKSVVKLRMARDHDEYGFKIIPDYEVEDMKLLAKIQALEIRSHNLLHQESIECPLLDRWAQYLAGRSDDDLCASPELKGLLRVGVPQEYRQRVWSWMVRARTRTIREHHPQCYQQLCEKSRTSAHPASRQIELDLHRTLTTNQHFCSPSSPALQQLRRILLAFSWRNPAIGYCQGLNRLAAIALLILQSEEDAFWCLVAVVEAIMPQDYYTKSLVASQADQRVLKDFLAEKLPRLAAHFDSHSIDVSLVTFNWFLVVFVESLPSDILLPLWDAFLYEGTKVIFRYALALFKYKEDDILKIHDSVEIYQYLRFFTKTISDGRRLIAIAFGDMNPFPRRLLRNRRALHLDRLQGELRELEEQQKEFVTERAERKDKELDTVASEDDEEL